MSDADQKKKLGLFKWILVVIALLAIVIIALPFLFDVNQFRPQIQSKFSNVLGRRVTVGKMKLSILSGSFEVDDITISDNPAFSSTSFLQAKSLKIGVKLIPLIFSKAIQVTGIYLDKPEIILIRSKSDQWNFSDLGKSASSPKPESDAQTTSADTTAPNISIKDLKITNGLIVINQGGKYSAYKKVDISAGGLSFDSNFPFSLSAALPENGSLQLTGKAGPLNKTDLIMTPLSADISVKSFDLTGADSGVAPTPSGIDGILDFSGALSSNGREVQSKGEATASHLCLVRGGSSAANPISLKYAVQYDLANNSGILGNTLIKYGKATAQLNGTFSRQVDALFLKIKLKGDGMPVQDIRTLLPAFGITLPTGASLEGGTLAVNMVSEGILDKLVSTGTVELSKSRLAGYDLGVKLSAIATLVGIKPSHGTEIEKFASGVRFSPDGIQASNMLMIVPDLGELSGDGKVASNQALDFKMSANLKPGGVIGAGLSRLTMINSMRVPFFIRGTASDPKFVPDMKNTAEKNLGDTLRNLFRKKN
jgi:AsmA protein